VDPVSHFIFNAIMDPVLEQLKQMKVYVSDEPQGLSALAFADDLILLATAKDQAQSLLHNTESYLNSLGVRIAAEKCASFEIRPIKGMRYITNPDRCLANGNKIASAAADSSLCYLAGHISIFWAAVQRHCWPANDHTRISTHLIPHFLHKAVPATPPISTIRPTDQTIRNHKSGSPPPQEHSKWSVVLQ
jgi:hypothetical protein